MKRKFLIVYDYGMGGVWGIAKAENAGAIVEQFPELEVHSHRPSWMTDEVYNRLERNSSFDVSSPATYPEWLQILVRQRTTESR